MVFVGLPDITDLNNVIARTDPAELEDQVGADRNQCNDENPEQQGSASAVLLQWRLDCHSEDESGKTKRDVMLRGYLQQLKCARSRNGNALHGLDSRPAAARSLSKTERQRLGHHRGLGGRPSGCTAGPSSYRARAYTRRLK